MSDAPLLFCQYADDLRQEVGGKTSLIGIYQSFMNVAGHAPLQLARLAVVAHLLLPRSVPLRSVEVRLLRDGEILQSHQPPAQVLTDLQDASSAPQAAAPLAFQVAMILEPFEVTGPAVLNVEAVINGEPLRGNPLWITVDGQAGPPA